jgi:hypothetical protein
VTPLINERIKEALPVPSPHNCIGLELSPGCTKTPERVYGFNQNGCTKTSRIRSRTKMWNLQCPLGAFDIAFEPAGGSYDYLARNAHLVNVRGVEIPVADLADVVASKRLANRPKDQLVLPQLDQALIDRDKGPEGSPIRVESPSDRARPTAQDLEQ